MRWQEPRNEEVRAVVDMVRTFGKEVVEPTYATHEDEGKFPDAVVEEMGKLGLFGLTIPEEYGGSGMGTVAASYVARELAYFWPSLHLIWTANSSLAAYPIQLASTEEQKESILPALARGEALGCYALTEPNAGSDAQSMQTTAELNEGGWWILRGTKTFITNARRASVAIIFAHTRKGVSAFVLYTKNPGLDYPHVTVRHMHKRVLKSCDFCEIYFDGATLPQEALLGEEGQGFSIAMKTLDGGRINIAAQAIGMATRIFDEALAYTRTREQFGKLLWENQKIQFDFAEAYANIAAAWALIMEASAARDRGEDITRLASAAKLVATETAWRFGTKLATYFGGSIVVEDLPHLARMMDIFPTLIYEGAN